VGGDPGAAVILETPRLRLEPLGPQHAAPYRALVQDTRVAATLGGIPDDAAIDAMLARQAADWVTNGFGWSAWLDRDTGEFVGRGGIWRVEVDGRDEVEIGWAVVADRWGEGLATEAAAEHLRWARDVLGLTGIVSFTLPDNRRSRRVMEKLGLGYEKDIVRGGWPQVLYRQPGG
jgi:RimJ/RimL family protein N-acetyltransferase